MGVSKMDKLKAALAGKKVYILMGFGVVASVLQYLGGFNFHITDLPPAESVGDLVGQIWAFAVASGFRAALAGMVK
jgi:hypothetical protein